ncbi:hypothetical protein HanHA300_Chr04g0116571 [Helianthus annuus]|nr:hypothetical protein HanHA300_Chr04g0116571 [Helianthus annuus]
MNNVQEDETDESSTTPGFYQEYFFQLGLIFAHTEKYPDEIPLLNVKRWLAFQLLSCYIWFCRWLFYSMLKGCKRGPSPSSTMLELGSLGFYEARARLVRFL